MYSIGIIAVAASLKNIMKIDEEMQKYCNVTYLPYTSNDHLMYVYCQNVGRFDALLFGGSYTYNIVKERVGHISLPCTFFNIADRDYYRVIAQLAIQEPGLDFSRVLFDKPDFPVHFEALFGRPGIPRVDSEDDPSIPYGEYWSLGLKRYHRLWKSGEVDWIVTRFGSMEDELQSAGIRYKLLLPSRESMLDTFGGLLTQIKESVPQNGTSCIGLLVPHAEVDPGALDRLVEKIDLYNHQMGDIFLIYRHGGRVELTTSIEVLKELTHEYMTCQLLPYLEETLGFPVSAGWGCAGNVITAHQNAGRALKEALRQKGSAAYVVTADGYVVGPLADEPNPGIVSVTAGALQPAGERYSLAKRYRQSLCAALAGKEEPVFCAQDLAGILNITTRSAARILSQLEASGAAVAYRKRNINQPGRPVKYYRIYPNAFMEK
ncbi:MAG: hypothetical protein VB071_08620 [Lawsonibacter sp.]|nr:hypothetical protein [Lawsonibacter sp.]